MFAVAQAMLMFAAGLRNYRYAIFLFLLFSAFAPRALGLLIPGTEILLTFPRMAFPLLLTVFLLWIVSGKNDNGLTSRRFFAEPVVIVLVLLGIHKIAATLWNGVTVIYAVESLLFTVGIMGIFYLSATPRVFKVTLVALLVAVLAYTALAPVEFVMGRPVYYPFADQSLIDVDRLARRTIERGYRMHGLFDNTLSLAEFMLLCLPWALYLAAVHRGIRQHASTVLILCVLMIGVLTSSRGFVVFALLTLISFGSFYFWDRFGLPIKASLIVIFVPVVLVSVFGAGLFLQNMIVQASGVRLDLVQNASELSMMGRALQFEFVYDTIMGREFFGVGVRQNFTAELETVRSLDNFYLRTMLESGLPGFLLFAGSMVLFLTRMFFNRQFVRDRAGRAFLALSCSLVIAFAGAKVFLSMPTGNFVFYALMGLLLGLRVQFERAAR